MTPTNPDSANAAFRAIADYLASQRETILQRWHEAVKNDPRLLMASQLKIEEFYNHIPFVLDDFQETLCRLDSLDVSASEYSRASKDTATDDASQGREAREHGLHRWLQGYRLNEVAREWSHLHECLMDVLDAYPVPPCEYSQGAVAGAQRLMARLFHNALAESIEQYDELQRRDMEGRLTDLKNALAELGDIERERGAALREASHDLRGSLSVVRGAASMLHRADLPLETRSQMHELLQRGVSSLHAMLTDLMDLARLEAGQEKLEVSSFDAAHLLREMSVSMQALAHERDLFLRAEGPEKLSVRGDASKIQRIAQNLLLNALKYTREGGVVVRWEEHDEKRWKFFVSDSGPGLQNAATPIARDLHAASQVAREAQADSKALEDAPRNLASTREATSGDNATANAGAASQAPHGETRGEGIGLSIVKRLCEMLDITLEVQTGDAEKGGGTTFCVVVPRDYPHAARAQKNGEHEKSADS